MPTSSSPLDKCFACRPKYVFTIFARIAAVKPIVVDVVYGILSGSMKQFPLIVLVAIFNFHGLLFDLIVPPQVLVLDSLNLKSKIYYTHI